MARRLLLSLPALLALLPGAAAWPAAEPRPAAADRGLADWSLQPFSDLASHGVLWRRGPGLLAWGLESARAWGSLAEGPHPAKQLFDLRLEVEVQGEERPRFAAAAAELESWPRWALERAADGDLQAQVSLCFAERDLALAELTLRNRGPRELRLRPSLRLARGGLGLSGSAEADPRDPALWLELDRSALAGRRMAEAACAWLGGARRLELLQAGAAAAGPLALGPGGLDLALRWRDFESLAPGESLHLPLLLGWGQGLAGLRKAARRQWKEAAQAPGRTLGLAKARWSATAGRLPAAPPGRERLLKRACLDLLRSEYGPLGALSASQFSAQKGRRDGFDSLATPLAALAFSALDPERAQGACLDLAAVSAAAPGAAPPFGGDEKLAYEAAGLPLNGWVAWALYHRDPKGARASQFLARYGERLRNECAWWRDRRAAAIPGLYAFAQEEEKPAFLRAAARPSPLSPAAAAAAPAWSLALSSLVAWQCQAAAALAEDSGHPEESEELLEAAKRTQRALQEQAWDAPEQVEGWGLEGVWPLLLGLERREEHAFGYIQGYLLKRISEKNNFWLQNGRGEPLVAYFTARMLASYGFFEESRKIRSDFLDKMEKYPVFGPALSDSGPLEGAASASTAALTLEFLLQRQEEELFLTSKTGEFKARFRQFRALDGSFYMKVSRIDENRSEMAEVSVETPSHGPILSEAAFILSAEAPLQLQFDAENDLEFKYLSETGPLPPAGKKASFKLEPKKRLLVRFKAETNRN